MKFMLGLAFGALGMWAYSNGKLRDLVGQAPAPMQDAFTKANEQVNQVAASDQVREFVSTARDKVQEAAAATSQLAGSSDAPSASEPPASA